MNHLYFYRPHYKAQPKTASMNRPEYPEVDPSQFQSSLDNYQGLINDAEKIVNHFRNSKQSAVELMEMAQQSQFDRVKELIQKSGITHPVQVNFTPNQMIITLLSNVKPGEVCCELKMSLFW
ncbi:MAG: hypothetical protein H0Z32_09775 [Bacillaceae bacterium]|nr:hypothetical protein [Bacillaceae bacterium]